MDISSWLRHAILRLHRAGINSARLDAELLLSHVLKKPREYLIAHPETQLGGGQSLGQLERYVRRREKREPLAYILGEKEFYGRMFTVNKSVLIPRPESEMMIDLLKQIVKYEIGNNKKKIQIADIGTGSGCLGVTAKLEFPDSDVTAIDTSDAALHIARQNARKLGAEVRFVNNDLLSSSSHPIFRFPYSILMANLPYVNPVWTVSLETHYEPPTALFAGNDGLSLIKQLITQTKPWLKNGVTLLIEADPRQHHAITQFAEQNGAHLYTRSGFILGFRK